jgi:hypothetical protein
MAGLPRPLAPSPLAVACDWKACAVASLVAADTLGFGLALGGVALLLLRLLALRDA